MRNAIFPALASLCLFINSKLENPLITKTMSRITLLLIMLVMGTQAAQAQIPGLPKPWVVFMKKHQPTQKTNSQAYRLIAMTNSRDEGSGFGPTDSTTYVYKSNTTDNVDSSYVYQWTGVNWEPMTLDVTEYNTNGWPVKFSGYYYAGPNWQIESRGAGTYDAQGNPLTMVYEEFDGAMWDTTLKYINTYQNGKLASETLYANQGVGLEPVVKTLYSYNAQGLEDTVETQMYFSAWVGMEKNVYTYNAAGLVLSNTTISGDFLGGWELTEQTVYTYNQRNHLINEESKLWNGTSWGNDSRTGYQVSAVGQVLDYLVEVWDGMNWNEDKQVINFYDFYHPEQLDSTVEQHKLNGNWVNVSSTANSFDSNGNHTLSRNFSWNGGSWSLVEESRMYYEQYNGPTGIGYEPLKLEGLSVYPNPVVSVATFNFTAERDGAAALAIFDLAGRQIFAIGVQSTVGSNTIHWDAGSQPAGTYIYKLNVDGKIATGKIVK